MAMLEEEQEAGVPDWVVTFGDMMSLLLTFFVLLFSMSEIKQEESAAFIESLHRQFGYETSGRSLLPGRFPAANSAVSKLASMGRARRMNTMRGGDKVRAPVGDYPRVTTIRPGEDATQGGVIHFEEGSAEVTPERRRTVQSIAQSLGGKPQKILVSGHTSARPLGPDSPYRSHWDLAYARCVEVMQLLVQEGISPKRILIHVAADNEPIHVGYDEVLRKKNARVEVVMLDTLAEGLEGTEEQKRDIHPATDGP